jgi:hydrogenase 3 maturation protease
MTAERPRLMELLTRAKAGGQPIVLLGIGNDMRGDDAVGVLIARDLEAFELPCLRSFPVGIALENSTHLVARHHAKTLLLVDAVSDPENPVGTWRFFPPEECDSFIHSTHSVPLSLFVSYWKREIPDLEIHFLGIGIGPTATFGTMCKEVQKAREEIVQTVLSALFT